MNFEVAIIGGGPAGISMAAEAIRRGISPSKVIVFEKEEEHSFAIRRFYPEEKLVTANYKGQSAACRGVMCLGDSSKQETLSYLDKTIEEFDINVKYRESVWKIEKNSEGFLLETSSGSFSSRICAIAIGMMGKPNKPSYKIPSGINSQIHFDVTSFDFEDKEDILVVGGGDSASEYAQYLLEKKNVVSLSYRGPEFSRMNDINRESLLALEARGEAKVHRSLDITELSSNAGKIAVHYDNGTSQNYDRILYALGGSSPKNFLMLLGIDFRGTEPILKEGYETSVEGLFLIGDLSAGRKGGSIISAFNSSHEAMGKICNDYLNCPL